MDTGQRERNAGLGYGVGLGEVESGELRVESGKLNVENDEYMNMTRRMITMRNRLCGILCCGVLLASCTDEEEIPASPAGEGAQRTFVLKYTLPDTEESLSTRTASYLLPVPSANENENRVEKLRLLFFEQDDFGNGRFAGMLDATLKGGSIEKSDSVQVTMGGASGIQDDRDYNVLIIANAHKYFTDGELKTFCQDKTENRVRLLQAQLPEIAPRVYEVPDDLLMMSGTALKQAGKDMTVNLVRAAVRIDVKIADDKKDEYVLLGATLRNASSRIPLFCSPSDITFVPLGLKQVVTSKDNTVIRGGLYLPETFRTGLDDLGVKSKQSACVLVSCRKNTYTGTRTWYRVDIRLEEDGSQYLRRNNAYMVVIDNINSPGVESPDEAYMNDATLLKTITIPVDWETPAGIRPPEVDIN